MATREPAPTSPLPATPAPSPTAFALPTAPPSRATIGLAAAPLTLDPANAADQAALLITHHLYEGLTAYEPGTTRAVPALAQAWQVTADGLTWSFRIRPEARFSNGARLTAEAVARNVRRWLTRTPPGDYAFWRFMFGGFQGETDESGAPLALVADVAAQAPGTVVLTLTRPDASLPNTLAMPAFGIVNPTAFAQAGFGSAGAGSAGSGPYVLAAWGSASLIRLARNPNYWGAAPGLDELEFKIIPDEDQRLIALQVGELDGMAPVSAAHYSKVQNDAALRLVFDPPLEVLYLGFNQARAPWSNLDCRLAVAAALDRARYVRDHFPGDATLAAAMQPPSTWGFALPPADRGPDLPLARASLDACLAAERGLPESISLYVPPTPRSYLPDPMGLAAAVQADLAAAGITVTVTTPAWPQPWLAEVQSGRADLFLLGWAGVNGDPDAFLCPLFCGRDAAFNSARDGRPLPPDPELAELLLVAGSITEPAERERLYQQAHARIFENVIAVPLAYRSRAWAFRADVTGYVPSPIESVFFGLMVAP